MADPVPWRRTTRHSANPKTDPGDTLIWLHTDGHPAPLRQCGIMER